MEDGFLASRYPTPAERRRDRRRRRIRRWVIAIIIIILLLLLRICGGCGKEVGRRVDAPPPVAQAPVVEPAVAEAPASPVVAEPPVPSVPPVPIVPMPESPELPPAPELRRRVDAPPPPEVAPEPEDLSVLKILRILIPPTPLAAPEPPLVPAPPKALEALPRIIIKTNLLYDVALTPNLGVEVLLGERFSVAAEFMRGWWLKRDWSFCWQLEAAALEGRYWWRDRMERHLRGGWFAGIFVQAGFYDFQLSSDKGLQGEFLTIGATGGYLYPLSTHWSIEFTLGMGYLLSDYRRYTVEPTRDGHELVASAPPMRFKGLPFPIKAGISIQWTIRWGKRREQNIEQ